MIQVTLNFPDQAALLAFFAGQAGPVDAAPAGRTGTLAPMRVEKPTAPKSEPAATTSSPKPSDSVDYPTLQKAVFALAGKSRDAAAAVAASFGVKTFKELPEVKWGDALAAVNAALAEAA